MSSDSDDSDTSESSEQEIEQETKEEKEFTIILKKECLKSLSPLIYDRIGEGIIYEERSETEEPVEWVIWYEALSIETANQHKNEAVSILKNKSTKVLVNLITLSLDRLKDIILDEINKRELSEKLLDKLLIGSDSYVEMLFTKLYNEPNHKFRTIADRYVNQGYIYRITNLVGKLPLKWLYGLIRRWTLKDRFILSLMSSDKITIVDINSLNVNLDQLMKNMIDDVDNSYFRVDSGIPNILACFIFKFGLDAKMMYDYAIKANNNRVIYSLDVIILDQV